MAEAPALSGARCLVLDDEFLIALDVEEALESAGAASVTCVSGLDEALAAIRADKFDIAVLDLNLGSDRRGSLLVAQELARQKTAFVFLTGMGGDAGLAEAYPNAQIVEKPYQRQLLLAAIQEAMDRV